MISFLNDYNEVGRPEVLEDLIELKNNKYLGYSNDKLVEEASQLIKDALNDQDVQIHFVQGGTISNVLSLMFALDRHQAVVACDTGHIVNTENGSIEALGNQVVLVPNVDGKVTIKHLQDALDKHTAEHTSEISVVYISNASEKGTIYKKKELEDLREFCDNNNLYLFCDGARIGPATVSKYSDVKFDEYTKYFDLFYLGGTKNGIMFGEALIIKNKDLQGNYQRKLIKQRGALLAKGFLYGSQFKTMFKDGLYFKVAKEAVSNAEYLVDQLKKIGYETTFKTETNLVFLNIEKELNEKLKDEFEYSNSPNKDGTIGIRLVATWNTSKEDIDKLIQAMKENK